MKWPLIDDIIPTIKSWEKSGILNYIIIGFTLLLLYIILKK